MHDFSKIKNNHQIVDNYRQDVFVENRLIKSFLNCVFYLVENGRSGQGNGLSIFIDF